MVRTAQRLSIPSIKGVNVFNQDGCGQYRICIAAVAGEQNVNNVSLQLSTELLLEDFQSGQSMNFNWSLWTQFWRNAGPTVLPPAQLVSYVGAVEYQEEPLNRVLDFGNFRETVHQGSMVIPDDLKLKLSIRIDYPSPVTTALKLHFHLHSILLTFDGAPTIPDTSTSSSGASGPSPSGSGNVTTNQTAQGRMSTSSKMGALGGTLGVIIVVLLAIIIIKWNRRITHGLSIVWALPAALIRQIQARRREWSN
ncbi:hypothetical protein FRC17_005047 [Serendipita sp. 399]|nr:hypothetical protein FRC17_005047 [Serendipita sp. 399]